MGRRDKVQLAVKTTVKIRERITYPVMAQPKLNGVRARIYKGNTQGSDLFDDSEIYIMSSEDNRYRIPHLEDSLKHFFDEYPNVVLDGEVYIHNEQLNNIIARLPKTNVKGTVSTASMETKDLEYHIFDIINEDDQHHRTFALELTYGAILEDLYMIEVVKHKLIINAKMLEGYMDECVAENYEGIIIRYPYSKYTPGSKRVKVMLKYKRVEDTECEILDVISEGMKNGVYVIKFLLKNDLNDETFLCNVGDDDRNKGRWTNEYKQVVYNERNTLIGRKATVKYYERSGIKNVPFHCNVVTIRDYE